MHRDFQEGRSRLPLLQSMLSSPIGIKARNRRKRGRIAGHARSYVWKTAAARGRRENSSIGGRRVVRVNRRTENERRQEKQTNANSDRKTAGRRGVEIKRDGQQNDGTKAGR